MRIGSTLISATTILGLVAGATPSQARTVAPTTISASADCELGPREVSERLRSRLPGRMMSIECSGSNYFVMWAFNDGSIGYLVVDGRTGRIISQRRGDAPRRP